MLVLLFARALASRQFYTRATISPPQQPPASSLPPNTTISKPLPWSKSQGSVKAYQSAGLHSERRTQTRSCPNKYCLLKTHRHNLPYHVNSDTRRTTRAGLRLDRWGINVCHILRLCNSPLAIQRLLQIEKVVPSSSLGDEHITADFVSHCDLGTICRPRRDGGVCSRLWDDRNVHCIW